MANINKNRKPNNVSEKPATVANINESSENVEMSTSENNNNNNNHVEETMENITETANINETLPEFPNGGHNTEEYEKVKNYRDDLFSKMVVELTTDGKPFNKMFELSESYTTTYMLFIFTFLMEHLNVSNPIENMKSFPIPEIWAMFFIDPKDENIHASATNTVNFRQSFINQLTLLVGKTKSIMSWLTANGVKHSWTIKTPKNVMTIHQMGQKLLDADMVTKRFISTASDATVRKLFKEWQQSLNIETDENVDESDE